jgi:tetratricopeptide (TPR) repeat protein
VLTEEALIFLGALTAIGLAVLGTLELVWPSRRNRSPRQIAAPTVAPLSVEPASTASTRRWRSSHPRHAAGATPRYLKRTQPVEPSPATTPVALSVDAIVLPSVEPAPAVESAPAVASVDRCAELYQARRYADAAAIATGALAIEAPAAARPADSHEAAALWSLLGLAQRAMGDHAAARAALETAIETAPADERATYEAQLARVALGVAHELVVAAGTHVAPESERRVTDLRDALVWLERAQAVAPDDAELRELATTAELRLWPAYEQVVMALVQRQEFRAARRVLHEALEDPRVPSARAETFRELFSGTFGGEIGQLTAQAIRSMQEARETEALGALERAERLLESVHEEALPPKRREEVDRRLWWGYDRLGRRRVEAGAFEEAIEPLVRALRLAGPAPDRQSETRAALVQAFEGWTESRALAIREVADGGDREAAMVGSDKLWTRLRAALEEGLSERDLAGAFARARRLFEEIGRRP